MTTLMLWTKTEVAILYGTTRTVFLVGHWAIKIPSLVEWRLFLMGLLANMQEAQFARLGWPELCPVICAWPLGVLLVMCRAEPLTRDQFFALNYGEWIKRGEDLPKGEWVIPVENKLDSFGLLDGRIVAVDYGS
jgi:hypothetical protein